MPDDRFFFPEDNGLNLQERGQADSERPLNESYYNSQYQFPHKEPVYTYNPNSQPDYKSGQPRTNMGATKTALKKGPSAQYRRERERVLSNTPVETLVQRLITQEYEAKEGRKLLHTAITQLKGLQRRANTAEEARQTLETGHTIKGLKIAESVMDAQVEATRAKHELELYRFQLETAQREIQNKQQLVKSIEIERDEAERSATKARALARQLNDQRLVTLAREEGRKLGYAEGMRQGRMLALEQEEGMRRRNIADRPHQTPLGSGQAFIEEYEGDTDMEDRRPAHPHQTPDLSRGTNGSQHPSEARRHRRHESRERAQPRVPRGQSSHTPRSQPADSIPTRSSTPAGDSVRQELDAAKERMEETVRREAEQRETIRQWELREAERAQEAERMRVKMKELELEREKREMREKEEARRREMEAVLERERERERELERERDEERRVREEREKELDREREREKELERERDEERRIREDREKQLHQERQKVRQLEHERERDMSSSSTVSQHTSMRSNRLPYLRMPQPPPIVIVEPPSEPATAETPPLRIPPPKGPPPPIMVPNQQTQPYPYPRGHRPQPSSPDTMHSASSITTGMSNLDIITFPATSGRVDGDWGHNLSDIPEVPSIRSHSRTSASDAPSPSPTWLTNPPPDFTNTVGGPDVDHWRRSTVNDPLDSSATSPITPTSRDHLSPSFQPRGRTNERSPYGQNQPRASSGSTVNIIVEPPSRPPSSAGIRDQETAGFLSPNSAPLTLVPEEQDTRPVIPDMVDPHDNGDLHNFPPRGFVPYKNPSETESGTGSSDSRRPDWGRGTGRGARLGTNIYANPPSQAGSRQAPVTTQTAPSIYGPSTRGPAQALKHQIYGPPSPSSSGSQPLQGDPSRIYGRGPDARNQIYAPPTSSSAASQTPRQIYGPTSPSLAGARPLQNDPSRIYAAPNRDNGVPRHQIYAPTPPAQSQMSLGGASRSGPVIPPPPSSSSSQSQIYAPVIPRPPSRIYAPASPATVNAPLGAVRSGPVIPPPPSNMTPRGRNAYPNATPSSFQPALPGTATPRTKFSGIYADPDEDGQDEQTRWNTRVNSSPNRLSQPPLPIPPPGRR
ncbi:hypothetical protein FPV67DRAFT_1451493 [Lyophyllum atratum]|nr:hypothetical protein FPV67DRAFT_1451493 [Lyophyllum atratum]